MGLYDGTTAPKLILEYGIPDSGGSTVAFSGFGDQSSNTARDVLSLNIRRGRTREDQTFQPGSMTVTFDNRSGDYDPDNTFSAYNTAFGVQTLASNRIIRLSALIASTTYVLFTGFIEQMDASLDLSPTVTMTCVDVLGLLSKRVYTGSRPIEVTSNRLLNTFPASVTSPSFANATLDLYGVRWLQAKSYDAENLSSIIDDCVASDAGVFYAKADNTIVFRPFEDFKNAKTTELTLTDDHYTTTGVEYDSVTSNVGAKFLVNTAEVDYGGSAKATATDSGSVSKYGTSQFSASTSLQNSISPAVGLAGVYANRLAYPITRISSVSFEGAGLSSTVWQSILSLELTDRATVSRTTVDGRTLSYDNTVGSINHSITPNSWRIDYQLEPYRIASSYSFNPTTTKSIFVLNTSTIGGTDVLWF
jgi:hypothetical protein